MGAQEFLYDPYIFCTYSVKVGGRGLEPPKPPPSAACELILVCVCVLIFELQSYSGGLLYDGQYIANTTSTIVVTINYRLGAMGFLVYGEGQDMPQGNYGLRVSGVPSGWVCVEGSGALKVSLSLEWVHSWMGVVLWVGVPTGQAYPQGSMHVHVC